MFLVQRHRARELAEILSINALAARGKPQEIKKQIKELTKDRGPG